MKILRRFLTSAQNLKVPLAFVAGTAIGVAGGWSIHAQQAATTPAFIVSEADEITDSTNVAAYGSKVGATLAPFAGHYHFVMAGGTPHTLDGGDAPKGLVAIAFDSAEQARAWYDSPAYQAILPLRLGSVKGRMFLVEGAHSQ